MCNKIYTTAYALISYLIWCAIPFSYPNQCPNQFLPSALPLFRTSLLLLIENKSIDFLKDKDKKLAIRYRYSKRH